MIVIFCDNIDDFVLFLEKRVLDEIFYEFKEITSDTLDSKINVEIILHFLAKIDNTMTLYETKQNLIKSPNSDIDKEVVNTLQKIFNKVDSSLSLIKGKIREIYLSYSS
ncbi:unnamed protein product [marine sediment metagenome]|uniref:Uncharacterized protein n=1 Tax=marine sediment metagenome TaxID=412755 RepID=X1AAC3_9ZZZZ